jgi:hypothetical protein
MGGIQKSVAGYFLASVPDPKDVGIMFLRIVGELLPDCTVPHPRRSLYSHRCGNLKSSNKHCIIVMIRSRDSSVGIATGYGLATKGSKFQSRWGQEFSLHHVVKTPLGPTQPPIQWVSGALSLGVKRPGREPDHPPPTSAEVKKTWVYTSIPPCAFMV